MLMKIDKTLNKIPSRAINLATGGKKYSSLCARLYLYRKYVSERNIIVNGLTFLIDGIEPGHTKTAARHWRIAYKKYNCYFPERYKDYLKLNRRF